MTKTKKKTTAAACPYCGNVVRGAQPEEVEGQMSVCGNCLNVSVFSSKHSLRKMTNADFINMPIHMALRLRATVEYILMLKAEERLKWN